MQRTPKSSHPIQYLSQPDLTVENQDKARNIYIRKRKNPDFEMMDIKDSLMLSFKSMLNSEITDIKKQNTKILESNAEIINLLQINASNYQEVSEKVETLEIKHAAALDRIDDLETQLEGIQKQLKRNTVEIRNVPKREKENLNEVVANIYSAINLKMENVPINVFRRGKNISPIIVEYQYLEHKEILIKAFKNFNNENKNAPLNRQHLGFHSDNSRIHITESLTTESKKIWIAARELVKKGSYKYCWTSRGTVLLRKDDGCPAIAVKSYKQLCDLDTQ
ncbi:uncharacterized protein LOC131842452 [Achroia grisella]|uniref:uncharacterized protein LOC131842452 n=1 Tax=Achroia grisella TaxID=688607 RepID=UPI0027D2D400|nr:uncharacterized protein LOC131842452 [Achroia grisella]